MTTILCVLAIYKNSVISVRLIHCPLYSRYLRRQAFHFIDLVDQSITSKQTWRTVRNQTRGVFRARDKIPFREPHSNLPYWSISLFRLHFGKPAPLFIGIARPVWPTSNRFLFIFARDCTLIIYLTRQLMTYLLACWISINVEWSEHHMRLYQIDHRIRSLLTLNAYQHSTSHININIRQLSKFGNDFESSHKILRFDTL